jgi:hypothetical protein
MPSTAGEAAHPPSQSTVDIDAGVAVGSTVRATLANEGGQR